MIKNVVFDIGNVIFNFNYKVFLNKYISDKEKCDFIEKNIINSPEWLGYSLLDTGYITKEAAISIVQDRTNHTDDDLIKDFWNDYIKYGYVDRRMIELIKLLKEKEYNVYLLSNINEYTAEGIKDSGLFEIVDGYVLSYLEHQIKPYDSIYKTLINRYNIVPSETIFIDDNENNIKTGNKLGFISLKVESDNYDNVVETLNTKIDLKGEFI